jgi:hypothetical protein
MKDEIEEQIACNPDDPNMRWHATDVSFHKPNIKSYNYAFRHLIKDYKGSEYSLETIRGKYDNGEPSIYLKITKI